MFTGAFDIVFVQNTVEFMYVFLGLSVESKDEGIVVSGVEEGRLAHVQGKRRWKEKTKHLGKYDVLSIFKPLFLGHGLKARLWVNSDHLPGDISLH